MPDRGDRGSDHRSTPYTIHTGRNRIRNDHEPDEQRTSQARNALAAPEHDPGRRRPEPIPQAPSDNSGNHPELSPNSSRARPPRPPENGGENPKILRATPRRNAHTGAGRTSLAVTESGRPATGGRPGGDAAGAIGEAPEIH